MNVTTIVDPSSGVLVPTIVEKALASIAHSWQQQKSAHIVLTGGRTGTQIARTLDTQLFRLLNSEAFSQNGSLEGNPLVLHVWFSDERFTDLSDPDRTDTNLVAQFEKCSHIKIFEINFHRVSSPTERSLQDAADEYAAQLDKTLGEHNFDAVILSMGEDGHVASLFPGLVTTAHHTKSAVAVDTSPKPPAQRVSISVDRLSQSSAIYIFVLGETKREALTNFIARDVGPVALLKEAGKFGQMIIATDLKI